MGDLLPLNLCKAPITKGVEATCLAEAALSEGCKKQTTNSYNPMQQPQDRAAIPRCGLGPHLKSQESTGNCKQQLGMTLSGALRITAVTNWRYILTHSLGNVGLIEA